MYLRNNVAYLIILLSVSWIIIVNALDVLAVCLVDFKQRKDSSVHTTFGWRRLLCCRCGQGQLATKYSA